ncbi:MAG: hypothetical protein TREMPRED_004257 [Tremellales sp. Tagirdzhanova-0007]|nr:MAG: hypothetical protein TREMPRED_004257 [Tremellales sp. Tagirdzhanova-0007]
MHQTGNLTVILVGGTLFVILAFALTTELFAKNSPSVLYSAAVDMIRTSDSASPLVLNPHLLPPLKFTHSPHASAPVRGSQPVVHRLVRNPISGRDHLLLTFWVHGRGRDESESLGWFKSAWVSVERWGRKAGKRAGTIQDAEIAEEIKLGQQKDMTQLDEDSQPGILGRIFGSLTVLRSPEGSGSTSKGSARRSPPPGTYKIGEVSADYVKNAGGQFTLLSLVIDVPSSIAPYPGRAVVFWSPEANTEGLLGRRER